MMLSSLVENGVTSPTKATSGYIGKTKENKESVVAGRVGIMIPLLWNWMLNGTNYQEEPCSSDFKL
jgi:hypothetical protein